MDTTSRVMAGEGGTKAYHQAATVKAGRVVQVGVVMGHKLSDSEAELLRESRAPITVVAADDDRLIKTEGQHRLAQLLDAQLVRVRGGHLMAYPADFEALMGAVTGQIDRASRAGVAA